MNLTGIIISFVAIAAIRIIQRTCHKETSNLVDTLVKSYAFGTLQQFLAAVISLLALFFVGFYGFNTATLLVAIITGILFALELWTSLEVLKGCSIAVASMFAFGGVIISVIASHFFFDEPVNFIQLIGLAMFFISVFLLTWTNKKTETQMNAKTVILLIVNFLVNGLMTVAQKYFSLKVTPGNTAMYSLLTFMSASLTMLIGFLIFLFINQRKTSLPNEIKPNQPILNRKAHLFALILAVCLFLLNTLITEMGKTLSGVILFPVSCAIGILMSVIVGAVFYKEKLSTLKIIGLVLGILSIVIISVFTTEMITSLS